MSESIEAPKRKYTRKPKVIASAREPAHTSLPETEGREASDSEQSTTSTDSELTPPEQVPQKPKRQYKKKEKKVEEPIVEEILYVPEPPHLVRQTNEPDEVSSSDEEKVKEKKPRTEKQQEAFRKMREARLKKTEELKKLKELEKGQKQLEREQSKLNTITEKVVEKATELKQRKAKPIKSPEIESREPQRVPQINSSVVCGGTHIQEKTNKPYIFV